MNNKILFGILIALLALYGISKLFTGNKETTFKTELIQIDTSIVTSIEMVPRGEEAPFTLQREDGQWFATQNSLSVKAVPATVQAVLGSLSSIKTKHIAAKEEEKWKEYELTEQLAHQVRVLSEGEVLESFYLGQFNFNQQARTATSYIRLEGEDEVYAVDGFAGMAFSRTFKDFRSAHLARTAPEVEFTAFSIDYGDTTLQASKTEQGWLADNAVPLDSAKVEDYLNLFRNLSGTNFLDNFDEMQAVQLPQQSLLIEGNNMEAPIEIRVFHDSTRTEMPVVVRSTYNPDTYFSSDSSDLYVKVIKPIEAFLPE